MTRALLFGVIVLFSFKGLAQQHPIIGTWKLVSVKGINADGQAFSLDTTQIRETKVITATHYMLIAEDVRGDSTTFNRCYAGTIRFDGNKFFETPFQASLPIFEGVKTDFSWEIKGDVFIQSGSIIRPDGKKIVLDALTYQRVKETNSHSKNPALGAWSLKSSTTTGPDGKKQEFKSESEAVFLLITPTHWMRISNNGEKFNEAAGGPYDIKKGKTILHIGEGSAKAKSETELEERVSGNQLFVKGRPKTADSKIMTWEVFERAQPLN